MPGGWAGVMDKFNCDGYGLTLIDADGIVRGVDIHAKQLKKLMKKLYPKAAREKEGQREAVKKADSTAERVRRVQASSNEAGPVPHERQNRRRHCDENGDGNNRRPVVLRG